MKRVLITGAAGFVGANLARRLLSVGHEVHLLVRPGADLWRLEDLRHAAPIHAADLADRDALQAVVRMARPEWVFHLAAHGAYPSQRQLQKMIETNIVGTANLLEACLACGCEVIVNTGSSSEYGSIDHAPAEVEAPWPNSHYAITKLAGTLLCRYTAQTHGCRLITLRLYSVYGPYEEPSRLLPTLIVHGRHGMLPPLADPDVGRDFVFIDDVIDCYILAAASPIPGPGAIYNVGTGVQTSLREVVGMALRFLPISGSPRWGSMPNRAWDTTVWVADSGKAHAELGWQPRYTCEQGMRAFIDWFEHHPDLCHLYEARLGAQI